MCQTAPTPNGGPCTSDPDGGRHQLCASNVSGYHHHSGTWCSGITSAPHAEGSGFKSQCVHVLRYTVSCVRLPRLRIEVRAPLTRAVVDVSSVQAMSHAASITRAHGVVVSRPLRMRKALGSNPSVSIASEVPFHHVPDCTDSGLRSARQWPGRRSASAVREQCFWLPASLGHMV